MVAPTYGYALGNGAGLYDISGVWVGTTDSAGAAVAVGTVLIPDCRHLETKPRSFTA
jgi:hypothetical protein